MDECKPLPLGRPKAAFDINNLVADIAENVVSGEVEFSSWTDSYAAFFDKYEAWWCEAGAYTRPLFSST